jgi:hypothetical protein
MTDTELARRVDVAARAVDGVLRLYAAAPIPARLARRITEPDGDAPLALVDRRPDRLDVTVSLGVSALRAASTTASLVADAVRGELASSGLPVHVHVRVSRVTEA